MAFSQARKFGGGVSRSPYAEVAPSRGAAGAPGGASLSGLPSGGSAANDIAGALGLGGGMLGKFLYDKYKAKPGQDAVAKALEEIRAGLTPSDPEAAAAAMAQLQGGQAAAPAMADPAGAAISQMQGGQMMPQAQPSMPDMGQASAMGSNFGAGVPAGLTGENLATYNSMLNAGISPTMITDWMTANGIMPMA